MRKKVQTECFKCKKVFLKDESEVKRNNKLGRKIFCSLSCASNHNHPVTIKQPNVECAFCKKMFYKNNSKKKNSKSGVYFCSRKCKDEAQKIKNGFTFLHPSHYKDGNSEYRKRALEELPNKCDICGYDKYVEILQVHHKDRNRSNGSLENLQVLCPNCHEEEHLRNNDGRYGPLVKKAITLDLQSGISGSKPECVH